MFRIRPKLIGGFLGHFALISCEVKRFYWEPALRVPNANCMEQLRFSAPWFTDFLRTQEIFLEMVVNANTLASFSSQTGAAWAQQNTSGDA